MLITCWSAKGGSGTTVVAVALSVVLARRSPCGALLVDLAGDAACAVGARQDGPGLTDWLSAGADVPVSALQRLEVEVAPKLSLLPFGESSLIATRPKVDAALDAFSLQDRPVVVDAGVPRAGDAAASAIARASTSLLVLRPCYLALRRAIQSTHRATGVVLVDEAERALGVNDIEAALGTPVVAIVPHRPDIARAVDAGLVAGRLPRPLASSLKRVA